MQRFVCRDVSRPRAALAPQSEKTYGFSALYMSVRIRRVDEFWNAARRSFIGGHRPYLNGGMSTLDDGVTIKTNNGYVRRAGQDSRPQFLCADISAMYELGIDAVF